MSAMFKSSHVKFFGHVLRGLGHGVVEGTESFQRAETAKGIDKRAASDAREARLMGLISQALPVLLGVSEAEDAETEVPAAPMVYSGSTVEQHPAGVDSGVVEFDLAKDEAVWAVSVMAFVADPRQIGQSKSPLDVREARIVGIGGTRATALGVDGPCDTDDQWVLRAPLRLDAGQVSVKVTRADRDDCNLHYYVILWCSPKSLATPKQPVRSTRERGGTGEQR